MSFLSDTYLDNSPPVTTRVTTITPSSRWLSNYSLRVSIAILLPRDASATIMQALLRRHARKLSSATATELCMLEDGFALVHDVLVTADGKLQSSAW